MNRWAAILAATPPTLQRLIASSQRISLPRRCPPAERLTRLRAALCRAAAVRAVYFSLAPVERQALQELRHIPRGLAAPALAARYGPIRPLADLRADRIPRTVSERLLLLGWLLPRPATRNHPTRYLLAPELRAWLPVPLPNADAQAPAPIEGAPAYQNLVDAPALRAATAILVVTAAGPLPLRADGRPTAAALHTLRPRLAPLAAADADALCAWVLPLLGDLGLLAPHGSAALAAPGAARFLAQPPAARLRALTDAWVRAPRPDRWLARLRVNRRGLDWPALRRRLLAWATALPADAPAESGASYALLQAALGPLADATTHGFCAAPRRAPWLPRRAAEVWAAACQGPLAWLRALPVGPTADEPCRNALGVGRPMPEPPMVSLAGAKGSHHAPPTANVSPEPTRSVTGAMWPPRALAALPTAAEASTVSTSRSPSSPRTLAAPPAAAEALPPAEPQRWHILAAGGIEVPPGVGDADLLALAPFAQGVEVDRAGERYLLSAASVARAAALGHDPSRLRRVLLHRCGALPPALEAALSPSGGLRLSARTVLLSDHPGDLAAALGRRSARRAVEAVLAPGVALVAPGGEAALARALARDGRAVAPPAAPGAAPPADLSVAEQASLLMACAHYRATAPAGAPPGPHDGLLERLRGGLPPALRAATEAAIAALGGASVSAEESRSRSVSPPAAPPPLAELLDQLRATLRRRGAVTLWYQGADETAPRERTVRPLRLERHGPWWYMHAYCLLARAERCFRLDRVRGLAPASPRTERPAPVGGARRGAPRSDEPRRAPQRPRSAPRAGFFAGPPDPPPGSPLIGVWLEESSDQPVGRLARDLPDAVDGDAPLGSRVEGVAAHAVAARVDQRGELAPEGRELRARQVALEDAALDAGADTLKELHHAGAAAVVANVVADQGEHRG